MATKSNTEITADVLAELAWDPAVAITGADVITSNGMVTLFGTVASYSGKYAATDAAYRVRGVLGVTNDIVVDPSAQGVRTDAAIQADVRGALTLDNEVPLDRLGVAVYDGLVTLTGNLDHYYQRAAAARDARQIAGVKGVVDAITVISPGAIADDVEARIARAFSRNGKLVDDHVRAAVAGTTVTLGGTVRTWSEYDEAAAAAWRAPGVRDVENQITVTH